LWIPDIIGHDLISTDLSISIGISSEEARTNVETEVTEETCATTSETNIAANADVEHAIGIEEEASGETGDPEEVEINAEGDRPVVFSNLDSEIRVNLDDLEDLNLTGDIEDEGIRR
jgi:hypothetical protein